MSPETTGLQRSFSLDSDILAPGSALTVDLSASTDADVAFAVINDDPFPKRASGEIALGHIGLTVAGDNPVAFTGSGTTVGFEFSAGITAGAGIFDRPENAVAALGFSATPNFALEIPSAPDVRYAVMRAGYKARGEVKGTHPIGAVGSFTFGVSGAASGVSAVVHRFDANTGARTVLDRTIRSWKLPRHVDSAARLEPGTWLVAEADGSVAARLAASLGYNFNFVHEARLAGLSGDIGLKIDAAATATFGFEVSGRYLVVIGRATEAARVRLQLFKLSRKGLEAGLNLKIGITGVETLTPESVDDFVSAVFGVHGAQVVGALKHLDEWTDPGSDVGELVAGLVNDKALELLEKVSGVAPGAAFETGRRKLLDAIAQYEKLPARVSSELLGVLPGLTPDAAAAFRNTLQLLASEESDIQTHAFQDLLSTRGFAVTPAGRIISALGENGMLSLLDRLPDLRTAAGIVLSILDGGALARLQTFVAERLGLEHVLAAATRTDFDALDSFLVGRLSAFFDRKLQFSDLDEIKQSIRLVLEKRADVYDKVQKALNSRYGLEVSATWQKTTARTALLDLTFDTLQDQGRALLASVLRDGEFDLLMTTASAAVEIRSAVLTHELTRNTVVDVSLPFLTSHAESFNTSMARVTAEDEGGRVLMYDATGQDVVAVRNRFRSSLSVSITAAVAAATKRPFKHLRVHSVDAATWSYTLLHAKKGMRRAEFEAFTRPFISQYMFDQFTGGTSLGLWYAELDRTVETILANGPDEFGDICASLQVTMPGNTLAAWMVPAPDVIGAAKRLSKAVQAALRHVLSFYYLTDTSRLHNLATTAALLGWASIRPSNDVVIRGDQITFDVGKRVFWDHVDPDARRHMLLNPVSRQNLQARLPPLRLRLEEAGMHGDLPFYQDSQVSNLLSTASGAGDVLVSGLLTFESVIVHKAAEALSDIQGFLAVADSSPMKAVERLAEFAADITTAFNKLTGNSVFAGVSFRAVSQTVFAEASRALDPGLVAQPRAMLALTVLKPEAQRTFRIAEFLNGGIPAGGDVALAQHLVSI